MLTHLCCLPTRGACKSGMVSLDDEHLPLQRALIGGFGEWGITFHPESCALALYKGLHCHPSSHSNNPVLTETISCQCSCYTMIHQSDFIIASNNSINDNMFNAKKAKSPAHRVKKMLKPLLKLLSQRRPKHLGKSCHAHDFDFYTCADNSANEELEARILSEIAQCEADAAVYVYEDGESRLQPVTQDQQFVPVHFARTNAGTFFWTTVAKEVDCDLIQPTYCCSHFQQPQLQHDRWVQA